MPNASSNITWCSYKLAENAASSTLQGVTESEFLKNAAFVSDSFFMLDEDLLLYKFVEYKSQN